MNTSFNRRTAQPSGEAIAATIHTFSLTRLLQPALLGGLVLLGGGGWAGSALAQQSQPVQVTQVDAESLQLRFDNPQQLRARVRVVHLDNDRELLNETYRVPAYGCRYYFNTLPAGKYALFLRIGPARYRYTVKVQTQAKGSIITALEPSAPRGENVLASVAK